VWKCTLSHGVGLNERSETERGTWVAEEGFDLGGGSNKLRKKKADVVTENEQRKK